MRVRDLPLDDLMEIRVKLIIQCKDEVIPKILYSSLKPDNIDLPKGLNIDMSLNGRFLVVDFSSIDRLETLISTIDDLLTCCQASLNTLKEIEQLNRTK